MNDHTSDHSTTLTDVFETAEPAEEASELVEELASTTTLYDTFGRFIAQVEEAFTHLSATSEESNPVRTHLSILSIEEEII